MTQLEDKLCFLQYQLDGQILPSWFMIQVDLDKADLVAIKQQGMYWVHWMVHHYMDCLHIPTKESHDWLEVHKKTNDLMNPYGPIIPIMPRQHVAVL
jgi:hypothetical protein